MVPIRSELSTMLTYVHQAKTWATAGKRNAAGRRGIRTGLSSSCTFQIADRTPEARPTLIDTDDVPHSVAMPGICLTRRSTRRTLWGTSRSPAKCTP